MHTVVSYHDVAQHGPQFADAARKAVIAESGVFNVSSGELRQWYEPCGNYFVIEARFHSSAWTGA